MDSNINNKTIKRALVLSGGGAKGAYAFGCLKAFKERKIEFDAVSGTSVGGLNAMLWSTDAMSEGQKLWDELSFSTVYPVRFLNPAKFPKFFIKALAIIIVFLNLLGSTIKGVKHPASPVTSLLLTIVTGFPYTIIFLGAIIVLFSTLVTEMSLGNLNSGILPVILIPFFILVVMFNSFHQGELSWAVLFIILWLFILAPFLPPLIYLVIIYLGIDLDKYTDSSNIFYISLISVVLAWIGLFTGFAFVSNISDYFLNKLGTVLDSAPLNKTVSEILSTKKISIPTFITTASIHEKEWVPHYTDISELSLEEATFHSVATAALPFGIVPSVKMQDREFVDGGVVDNIPYYPFIEGRKAQEIYVVILDNFESDEEAQKSSEITPESWSELEGLKKTVELKETQWKKTIPYENPKDFPKLVFFYPRSGSLGNFLTGTLNFNGTYAKGIMEKGYLETLQKLDEIDNVNRN